MKKNKYFQNKARMKLLSSIKLGNYFFICSDASCHVYKWALAPATKIQFIQNARRGDYIAHKVNSTLANKLDTPGKGICNKKDMSLTTTSILIGWQLLVDNAVWVATFAYICSRKAFSKIAQSFCKTTMSAEVWVANVPTDVFFNPLLWRTHCHKISNGMVTSCHKIQNCDRTRQEVRSTLWTDCCSVSGNFVYFNWIAGCELVSRKISTSWFCQPWRLLIMWNYTILWSISPSKWRQAY